MYEFNKIEPNVFDQKKKNNNKKEKNQIIKWNM